jgi:TIR domain
VETVVEHRTFQAFFSYAHDDAKTDQRLVEALTTELEIRVTARLVNDRFVIWRDTNGLRTADLWNLKIENAVRDSDLLIVLLTPRWITSDYCRKEYTIFQKIQTAAGNIPQVAPIAVRSLEQKREQFEPEQTEIYESLRARQYFQLVATRFLQLRANQRSVQIEKIADDIERILERCRQIPKTAKQARSINHPAHTARLAFALAEALRHQVNVCRQRDVRFRSAHILAALFSIDESFARKCFASVSPHVELRVEHLLERFTSTQANSVRERGYKPIELDGYPLVLTACKIASKRALRYANERDLTLAFVHSGSNFKKKVACSLGLSQWAAVADFAKNLPEPEDDGTDTVEMDEPPSNAKHSIKAAAECWSSDGTNSSTEGKKRLFRRVVRGTAKDPDRDTE